MIRVLLDSNVLISGILFRGKPRQILDLLTKNKLINITSNQLLTEVEEVLGKKFSLTTEELIFSRKIFQKNSTVVYPKLELTVCRDAEDNKIIEAAITGDCNYLVTGDKDILILRKYKSIQIINPSKFLDIFKKESPEEIKREN